MRIFKREKVKLFAEMLLEQLFLEFANCDTEFQPKFLVQTCSSANRGRLQVLFYFRLIKEEKENTEQQAEKTESMEGRRSLGNLRRFKSVSSLNRHPASLHAAPAHPAVGAPSPEGGTAWRRRETGWAS